MNNFYQILNKNFSDENHLFSAVHSASSSKHETSIEFIDYRIKETYYNIRDAKDLSFKIRLLHSQLLYLTEIDSFRNHKEVQSWHVQIH